MPELPEVETVVRKFAPILVGKTIEGFVSYWPRQISPSVAKLRRAITGRTITGLRRRAKQIVIELDDQSAVLIHLKMSGRFEWSAACVNPPDHVRARFLLSGDQTLLFCDTRKFGRIRHVKDPQTTLSHLGPEPLAAEFSAKALANLLTGRKRRLKPLLMDQTVIAGMGNIYADESLFRARLHPLRSAYSLSWDEIKRLHRAIRQVLREAIRRSGTTFDWVYPGGRMQNHLRVYGRKGRPCPVCGRPIELIRVAQRSTHLCPACQKPK
jgi:formamidopyrimidine-DNA glycosylase